MVGGAVRLKGRAALSGLEGRLQRWALGKGLSINLTSGTSLPPVLAAFPGALYPLCRPASLALCCRACAARWPLALTLQPAAAR